jgi:uncharacterized zinc-type alcohol dehydrogenase-like protein
VPLLCAGVTNWLPLRLRNADPGSRVAVAGLGGLGHMAVKLTVGLGADVAVISRTRDAETQELLDFCAKKNILPECEMIRMDQINAAFERMEQSDVRSRFVIDRPTLEG